MSRISGAIPSHDLYEIDVWQDLSGTQIASPNRSDHGGRKRARNESAAEIAGFFAAVAAKKSLAASDLRLILKIAGSSQRPWPQVAAAARFRGRSDHGTLRARLFGFETVLGQVEVRLFSESLHATCRARHNPEPRSEV